MRRPVFMRGATAWEAQIGRVWIALRFPRFWLYSRNRAEYIRSSRPYNILAKRAWLYKWPGFVTITPKEDA